MKKLITTILVILWLASGALPHIYGEVYWFDGGYTTNEIPVTVLFATGGPMALIATVIHGIMDGKIPVPSITLIESRKP